MSFFCTCVGGAYRKRLSIKEAGRLAAIALSLARPTSPVLSTSFSIKLIERFYYFHTTAYSSSTRDLNRWSRQEVALFKNFVRIKSSSSWVRLICDLLSSVCYLSSTPLGRWVLPRYLNNICFSCIPGNIQLLNDSIFILTDCFIFFLQRQFGSDGQQVTLCGQHTPCGYVFDTY